MHRLAFRRHPHSWALRGSRPSLQRLAQPLTPFVLHPLHHFAFPSSPLDEIALPCPAPWNARQSWPSTPTARAMPTVTIVNDTNVPLHISLRHISPIHFQNNVAPGKAAVLKCGRVFFTIQARIARGGAENNVYTLAESVAAPIAVSLCAVSLGAGAVWVAGAATAAGGVTAAVTTISARVGAAAASQAPTARRLYKYARQGQRFVQIGQVIGLGGGALLGKKAAEAQQGGPAKSELERKQEEKGGSSWFAFEENRRIKEAKKVLKGLLEGSVVHSQGWYIGKDRTIHIRGGPRATEVDGLLIIETDTLEPFEVVSETLEEKDGEAAYGDGTGEGALKTWWSSLSQKTKGKGKEGVDEIRDSQTSFHTLEAEKGLVEETAYQRNQRLVYEKLSESSQWIYSRIRRGPNEPAPSEEAEDAALENDLAVPSVDLQRRAPSPAPPQDDDPIHPPTLEKILQDMGFNDEHIREAKAKVGELPTSEEEKEARKAKIEEAILLLLNEEGQKAAEADQPIPIVASSSELAAGTDNRPILPVVGAEKVTTPHWTTKAKQAAEASGALKILNLGGSHLADRGERWLQKS